MLRNPFGPIYEDIPLDEALGYPPGTSVRMLVNPTKAQWQAWLDANAIPAEPATPRGKPKPADADAARRQEAARVDAMAACLHVFYGKADIPGFDFSSPEAARATWDRGDVPDELWILFLQLPWEVITQRREAILKNVQRSPGTSDSTTA